MGLLDDAIREHLELKRQHGADPDEVSRQEREALGATRKAEFARTDADDERLEAEAGVADPEAEAAVEAASDTDREAAPAADFDAEPAADFEAAPDTGIQADPGVEPEREADPEPEPAAGGAPFDVESIDPPREPAAAEAGYEEDPWLEDERDEVPAGDSLEHPRAPEAEREGQESEDVLEETPDFLQETPEHDRLWFEQRPPRDFDWDK